MAKGVISLGWKGNAGTTVALLKMSGNVTGVASTRNDPLQGVSGCYVSHVALDIDKKQFSQENISEDFSEYS